jgi:hypothetical protein
VKFTVIWTPTAEQDLAAVWMAVQDRGAVNTAVITIDFLLGIDPESRGVASFDTVRILFVPPLGTDFDVDEPNRIVYVLSVWLAG